MTVATWLEVLDETIGASVRHHRPDLAERLRAKRAQLLDPQLRVLVIGEANQGKSQLVNALVAAPVCAVGDVVDQTGLGHVINNNPVTDAVHDLAPDLHLGL